MSDIDCNDNNHRVMTPEAQLLLIRLLRETLYGDGKAFFATLKEQDQLHLCRLLQKGNLLTWTYRMLHDVLPSPCREEFRAGYLARSGVVEHQKQMLLELYELLEKNRIRFAPFKGADLAFELYPDPVLRYFCDFDILIHPEDHDRISSVLEQAQWLEIPGRRVGKAHQHFSVRVKKNVCIEPHRRLPNFGDMPVIEAWKEFHLYREGGCRYQLSPEMRLLLLIRHTLNHGSEPLGKLLLDAAFILQGGAVDMQKLTEICRKWHLSYPGHFIAAFPDFFPEEIVRKAGSTPEAAGDFRDFFLQADICAQYSHWRQVMHRRLFSWNWMKTRLSALEPAAVRDKYRLPQQGAYGKLCHAYAVDVTEKSCFFIRHVFARNHQLCNFFKKLEQVDRYEP